MHFIAVEEKESSAVENADVIKKMKNQDNNILGARVETSLTFNYH